MLGKGLKNFCPSGLSFWMRSYTNVATFVPRHFFAIHGHFHGHQFLTANYFFIRPVLSYLAVATATWEHCLSQVAVLVAPTDATHTPPPSLPPPMEAEL